jgi:hypothetical protein
VISSGISLFKDKKIKKSNNSKSYKKLKKWQLGGIIGCIAGTVFAVSTVLGLQRYQMGMMPWDWILRFHSSIAVIYAAMLSIRPYIVADLATGVSIIILYGVYGIIMGRFQQIANPYMRWVFTGLSIILLLFIYWFNFQIAMLFENI